MTLAEETEQTSPVCFRAAKESDLSFLRDSWLKSYQRSYMEAPHLYARGRSAATLFAALRDADGEIDWDWSWIDPKVKTDKYRAWRALRAFYFDDHLHTVDRLLTHGRVVVCCNQDYIDQILGWVCFEPENGTNLIHYLFVKSPFRRVGIGRELLDLARHPHQRFRYSHATAVTSRFLGDLNHLGRFSPEVHRVTSAAPAHGGAEH